MSTVAEQTYTPEVLLAMPDRKQYELDDGHLVARHVSRLSNWVSGRIHRFIDVFVDEHELGWAWAADQGYVCFPDSPRKARFPDVSFVRTDRLPGGLNSEGFIDIPPDLAVEVVSPNDLAYGVNRKVIEYLDAGVALVWVIYPDVRVIHVYRRDGSLSLIRDGGELLGEDVLPGFQCRVSAIFPEKSAVKP